MLQNLQKNFKRAKYAKKLYNDSKSFQKIPEMQNLQKS